MTRTLRVGGRVGLLLAGLALLQSAVGSSSATAGPNPWCEASEAIRSKLEPVGPWAGNCSPGQPCWQSHIEAAKQLLAAHPDDLFVNRTYQDLVRIGGEGESGAMTTLVKEYSKRAKEHPDDPVAQYLAARITDNNDEARKLYEKAITLAPDFPWGHLGLAVTEARKRDPASRDQALMKRQVERVMALCPTQVAAVLQLSHAIEDEAFWRGHLAGVRAALQVAEPHEQVRAYRMLWSLEFRMAPLEQHPGLRKQVAEDLKAIEALNLVDDPVWWATRSEGLQLAGDTEAKKRLDAEFEKKEPCSFKAVMAVLEKWRADHPPPSGAASEEEKAGRAKEFYDATTEWLARCSDEFNFWLSRLFAIQERKDLPNEAVKGDLDRILEVWERNKNNIKMGESPYVGVARVFLERGLELERAPSLVEKEIELCREAREGVKTFPEEREQQRIMFANSMQLARLQVLAARAELALGRRDAARKALETAASTIDSVRAAAADVPRAGIALQRVDADLLEQQAGLAAAEGRAADASAMLLKASILDPTRTELAEKAQTLWQQAGGSAEGWALLTATLAEVEPPGPVVATDQSGWEKSATVLKSFNLRAFDGKRWTLDDLKGKIGFVNVWATWCGPCREELPEVQTLYERLKDRKDVVLLTFDVDTDVGLVAPFLADKKYSFPALLASEYIKDLWKDSLSIPRNWILDRVGTVRYEQTGFSMKGRDSWADNVLKLIDELGQEKTPPGGAEPAKKPSAIPGP